MTHRHASHKTFGIAIVLLSFLAIGCAGAGGPGDSVKGISNDDANRLNSTHSRFESSEDPPFTADTRFAAGRLAESQNAPRAAIEQYNEALKINPKHEASLYRLGVVQTQLKLYPDAIKTWRKYVEVTEGSSTAYSNLAFCYELSGQPRDAEATYQKGIAKDPKGAACRVNYGLMLARMNRINEAITHLGAVLSPAEVHYNIGSVYEQTGRKEEAKAEYEKAISMDPELKDARVRLARLRK